MMKQLLCVWFPNWPLQRILVAQPELRRRPVVLHTSRAGRTPRVTACSAEAARRGISPALPLAEAEALAARGWFIEHDPAADLEHLRRLAWSCQRFTPLAGLEPAAPPDSLWLDATGCVGHFGDLPGFCGALHSHFLSQGFATRCAAAPTFAAAWALVHFPSPHRPRRRDRPTAPFLMTADALSSTLDLPVAGLRLPAAVLDLLAECGLITIRQLLALPRASLPSRFGRELPLRIEQLLGEIEETLTVEFPPQTIEARLSFEFPLQDGAAVQQACRRLLQQIEEQLLRQRRRTQRISLRWTTEDRQQSECEIRLLRPADSAARFWELLELQLERWTLSAGVMSLIATAAASAPGRVVQHTLFDAVDSRGDDFLQLVERLDNRLGAERVLRYQLRAEAQPERAPWGQPWTEAGSSASPLSAEGVAGPGRPLRIWAEPAPLRVVADPQTGTPQRFTWRERLHRVALCAGPERIVTGWWREATIRRDYYRVETTQGQRFWLLQQLDTGDWFLHGVFD